MTDYPTILSHLAAEQTATIARHQLADGQTVWVRKVGKTIPPWRYKVLGWIADGFHLGVLQPVPNLGGAASLATEVGRLKALNAANVHAPRLLAEQSDAIMFSHLGETTLLSEVENTADQLSVWMEGLAAIAHVHRQQQYLSQSFARNMIRSPDGRIGFIDFEDDPGQYMPLLLCQTRDYLCYLQSTAMWLKRKGSLGQAALIWRQHLATLPQDLQQSLLQTSIQAHWLRHLKYQWMGNDTLRLCALGELFYLANLPD